MSTLPKMALSKGAENFVDDEHLHTLMNAGPADPREVRTIIARSMEKEPLTIAETAVLVRADQPELTEEIFAAARQLKRDVYGNRIVLFAPLYIGNFCMNDCQYCAFRRSNPDVVRHTLDQPEVIEQVQALERQGHKRLILVFGEHPRYDAQFIADTVDLVYRTKIEHGDIRRVNINAAPLDVEGYRIVRSAGIGTYQVFQETYHQPTYEKFHPPIPARATISTASTPSAAPRKPASTTSASAPSSASTTGASKSSP
jgi:2-iminoacetate synthase